MSEKVKPIILTDNETGKEYTLEFNRMSVAYAENRGFDINRITDNDKDKRFMADIPDLFFYSFRMHHRGVPREVTDKILFEELGGLTVEAITRLIELYNLPYNTLIKSNDGEEEDGGEKNSKMTMVL